MSLERLHPKRCAGCGLLAWPACFGLLQDCCQLQADCLLAHADCTLLEQTGGQLLHGQSGLQLHCLCLHHAKTIQGGCKLCEIVCLAPKSAVAGVFWADNNLSWPIGQGASVSKLSAIKALQAYYVLPSIVGSLSIGHTGCRVQARRWHKALCTCFHQCLFSGMVMCTYADSARHSLQPGTPVHCTSETGRSGWGPAALNMDMHPDCMRGDN